MMLYLLTAVGLTPGGSGTVHIYTQTVHRTILLLWEECGPCPVFASYTLAFALQLRKKHGKTEVKRVYVHQLAGGLTILNFEFRNLTEISSCMMDDSTHTTTVTKHNKISASK